MRLVSTGIEQLQTSDAIADAVLSYAAALARVEGADTVVIPIVVDGAVASARLLLGPASQLTTVPVDVAESDLPEADAVVRDMDERAARLQPAAIPPDPGRPEDDSPFDRFGDLA